jgi:hypothetical protein
MVVEMVDSTKVSMDLPMKAAVEEVAAITEVVVALLPLILQQETVAVVALRT